MNDTPVPAILLDYIEGLKTHDVARIAATMADDLVVISSGKTVAKADFLPFLHALYTGFPDWRYDHDAPERAGADAPEKEGDWWFVRWRQGGTHAGVFNMPGMAPIPATHRKVQIPEQRFFYRIAGDRLVAIRPEPIEGGAPRGILQQIGVALPPL